MAAIALPTNVAPESITFRKVGPVFNLEPVFGGETTRLNRLPKWAADVVMPSMSYTDAMKWLARLSKGDVQPVSLPLQQPGLEMRGRSGTLLVNGGSQTGTTLAVDGGNANYLIREGQWVSVTVAAKDRSYLYQMDADTRISALGAANLVFTTPLRRSPANNDSLTVEHPVIEGYVQVNPSWSVESFHETGIRFTITERE